MHEGDRADGGEDRPRQRQRDMAEKGGVAAAVDERRLEKLMRQIAEEAPEQKDAHGEAEGDLRQHDAEISVEQAEIAHLDEQRQDRRRGREQQAHGEIVQQHGAAEEFDVSEDEGRHRGDDQRQQDGERRDDQRIAQQLPVALREQDVGVVLPFPAFGRPKGLTRSSPSDLKPPSTVARAASRRTGRSARGTAPCRGSRRRSRRRWRCGQSSRMNHRL